MARNKKIAKNKFAWYVHRLTYMGRVEAPSLWRMEKVALGSERDKMLASGYTTNDAGELVRLPGEWFRFESRASAETWMEAEAELYETWRREDS
jgi:hypothetical protein